MSNKISRDKLKALTAIADVKLAGTYHQIYERYGAKKGRESGNFHCFGEKYHSGGCDCKPSMGISNSTGVYNCFTCDEVKGNLYTFWRDYLQDSGTGMYHDFLMNDLGIRLEDSAGVNYKDSDAAQMNDLYAQFSNEYEGKTGKPHVLPEAVEKSIDEDNSIPMEELDGYVKNLLGNDAAMRYLYRERRITEEIILKYKLGLTKGTRAKNSKAFIFPIMSPTGLLSTMKAYNPMPGARMKWRHLYRERDIYPVPIQNFASDTIYLFEGEPDAFCAIGFGISGAVTLGSAATFDPVKMLGESLTKRYFSNKEVIIVFDSDDTGVKNGRKLANNILPYARQVKLINLDKSEENPYGLDPSNVVVVKAGSNTKKKRVETDFTDFMKKNGFDDKAIKMFYEVVRNTQAYSVNTDRSETNLYKVTVQESRLPKYHSEYGGKTKRLELIASVSDIDHNSYLYYDRQPVECPFMNSDAELPKKCKYCSLPLNSKEFDKGIIQYEFHKEVPGNKKGDLSHVRITEKDILELIEVNEKSRLYKLKTLIGINTQCNQVRFREGRPVKVTHTKLMRDVAFHQESDGVSDIDIDVDAYVAGCDLKNGKTYRFEGVQTTSPEGQYAAIFADKSEPVLTTIEQFEMSPDIHSELRVFRPKEGETIRDHLTRRYDDFGQEAKITGRHEVFLMYDLAFFSSTGFDNSLISDSVRRWVEVGIIGASRCGKSIIAEFGIKKYRTGEFFSCTSAVSRTGVLGGIAKQFKGKSRIAWGVIPRNDGSILVMDEVANMKPDLLSDMTPCRTSGVVNVEMALSGKANANTRKIFISNPRNWERVEGQPFEGFAAIRDLYVRDEIIQRFDMIHFIKAEDVDVDSFEHHYEKRSDDFTDLQCRHLIMWAHSRKKNQYVWEGGQEEFNKYVRSKTKELRDIFHDRTLLVGQESNVRIIRCSVSLAAMMYSTPEDDYNKVLVKRDHVDEVVSFMISTYTHSNMRLNEYSEQIRASERLGDMRFMENIIKFVDVDSIIRENSFTTNSIQQVFFDYLYRVFDKSLYIVDAASDKRKSTGLQVHVSINKLVQTMVSRNCLTRNRSSFEKTPMFTSWLDKMRGVPDDELSDILEFESDPREIEDCERASKLVAEFEKLK